MRIAGILALSLFAFAAAGCKSPLKGCSQSNEDYAGAKEMPPLKAPPGLDAPETRNALRVPPLDTPERVRGPNEPCLDTPPPYSTPKAETPKA
jgi:uncharacterized lipoprotein